MNSLLKFLKSWMLVIAMIAGAAAYIVYHNIPALAPAGPCMLKACRIIQPILLFGMLFIAFSRIEPRAIRPHRWQWWLLLIQAGSFIAVSLCLVIFPGIPQTISLEAFMICMICPTATSCAIVTDKLGGDMTGVLTYTILINIVTAVTVPLFVPLVHPQQGLDFFSAFNRILAKVFPLLIMPCLCAWLMRYLFPHAHRWLMAHTILAFYLWACALTLAILMSTRALFHHEGNSSVLLGIAAASLVACALQFRAGKKIGGRYGSSITAGQSLGQKNTVFAIWMGYTFLDPVTSLAGGFYSIWHNIFNSWQLNRCRRPDKKS